MKKILGVGVGVLLPMGVSWAAFASPAPQTPARQSSTPTVTVTVPGSTVPPPTTTRPPGHTGPVRFHWVRSFTPQRELGTDGYIQCSAIPPEYNVDTWGLIIVYLIDDDGNIIDAGNMPGWLRSGNQYAKCGASTNPVVPPDPLDSDDAIDAARNEGDLAAEFSIDPGVRGLTGLSLGLDANVTSAGTVTASNAISSMTATITATGFNWKMGEDGWAYGQHTDYTFDGKGTHNIVLTVTWEIQYTININGTITTGTETITTESSRDYPVVEARGVLTSSY